MLGPKGQDYNLLKRYAFELMKLDYSIDYIKSYDSGKTNLSSIPNSDVYFDFQGLKFNRKVTVVELNQAKEEIESSLIPASDKELAKGLTKLSVLTKSRNQGLPKIF